MTTENSTCTCLATCIESLNKKIFGYCKHVINFIVYQHCEQLLVMISRHTVVCRAAQEAGA